MEVVNVREAGGWSAFVARRGVYMGSSRFLGNPFYYRGCDRLLAIERYRRWLWRRLTSYDRTIQMALSRLPPNGLIGCAAWFRPCHCEVIAATWSWWDRVGHRTYGGIRPELLRLWQRRGEAGSIVEPRQVSGPAALTRPGPWETYMGGHRMQATKTQPERPARQRTFTITFAIGATRYTVFPLRDADPSVATKAYRFLKRDAGGQVVAIYDVRLSPEGHIDCDCMGFLRWGHCRHQETLQAAGCLPK